MTAGHLLDDVGDPGTEGEEDTLVDPDHAAVLGDGSHARPGAAGQELHRYFMYEIGIKRQ